MYKAISVDSIDNEHPAKAVYQLVSESLNEIEGWNIDLVSYLSGPENTGITMEMSEEMDNFIRDGRFPFSIDKNLKGYFGESTGSANVTTVRLERNMNITDVLQALSSTGQIKDSLKLIDTMKAESDPDSKMILAYAIGQYAKGWLAEEIVSQDDMFKKGSVSQDEGGIDFYVEGDMSQLGSITRYNSKKKQMEASDIRHLLYQWDSDGNIHVADMDEILDVNKKIAKKAGLSSTLTRRSASNLKVNKELGRSFRYLWW